MVAVLFHGSWTQESQHAVGLLQQLAGQRHQHQGPGFSSKVAPQAVDHRGTDNADKGPDGPMADVVLAEADVMTLIDVAERQAIAALPSVHLHLGGREVLRFPVKRDESVESVGARIHELASTVHRIAEETAAKAAAAAKTTTTAVR